jgi:hypothetical protein
MAGAEGEIASRAHEHRAAATRDPDAVGGREQRAYAASGKIGRSSKHG